MGSNGLVCPNCGAGPFEARSLGAHLMRSRCGGSKKDAARMICLAPGVKDRMIGEVAACDAIAPDVRALLLKLVGSVGVCGGPPQASPEDVQPVSAEKPTAPPLGVEQADEQPVLDGGKYAIVVADEVV